MRRIDGIEFQAVSGAVVKIEIAPFNLGETFKNVLMTAWEKAKRPNGGQPVY